MRGVRCRQRQDNYPLSQLRFNFRGLFASKSAFLYKLSNSDRKLWRARVSNFSRKNSVR